MSYERLVKVNKAELIEQIEENKKNHEAEYHEAVKAYKVEAKKQLQKQMVKLEKGDMDIHVSLTTPVLETEKYDKLVKQFKFIVEDEVTLSQGEFDRYVHDDTSWARSAKMSNTYYSG